MPQVKRDQRKRKKNPRPDLKKIPKKLKTSDVVDLHLYVAGQTPRSIAAISNLNKIFKQYSQEQFHLKVIDLAKDPSLAGTHQILAIPTLVRSLPVPIRKIIGDLSDIDKVVIGLNISISKGKKPVQKEKD